MAGRKPIASRAMICCLMLSLFQCGGSSRLTAKCRWQAKTVLFLLYLTLSQFFKLRVRVEDDVELSAYEQSSRLEMECCGHCESVLHPSSVPCRWVNTKVWDGSRR